MYAQKFTFTEKAILYILLILIITSEAYYSPNLKISNDLNQLLLELSIKTNTPLPSTFYMQPIPIRDIELFLDMIDTSSQISSSEIFQINKIRRIINPSFKWTNSQKDISIRQLSEGFQASELFNSRNYRIAGELTPALTGNIKKLSYYYCLDLVSNYWTDTLFYKNSQPYEGYPNKIYGHNDSSHFCLLIRNRGGIATRSSLIDFEIAIDNFRQGPAFFYPLTFSGYAPPVKFARLRLDLGILQYFHSVGLLESQKTRSKFFYTHRYQTSFWKNRVTFGFNEVIINGSTTDQQDSLGPNALRRDYYGVKRNLEWTYMIPIIPMKFVEHYNGDRDNGLISFDMDLHFPQKFRWYFEFLLDDISSPFTLFSDDWGNKWALTAGGQWFTSIKGHDFSTLVEYSRVEPWVYTHFYGGSHRYDHYNVPLGNPLGPNSDALKIVTQAGINAKNSISFSFTSTRWNHTTRGGNITDVFQDSSEIQGIKFDSEKKKFLRNGSERCSKVGIEWKSSPFTIFSFGIISEYEFAHHKLFSTQVWGRFFY